MDFVSNSVSISNGGSTILSIYLAGQIQHHNKLIVSGNVAYHKTATQSSDPETEWSEKYPADRAVDGSTDPHIENGHCAYPDDIYGQHAWWTVDLKETVHIYYVIIYNRDQGE